MTTESSARFTRVAAGCAATAVAISAFGLAATPAVAAPSTVRVHLAEIGEETTSYPANTWFQGGSAVETVGVDIVDDTLVLNRKTQLLTELKGGDLPSSVDEIIEEGLAVDVSDDSAGGAGLQIALGWTGGWTTLRPASDVDDLDVTEDWISSRSIGGVTTGTLGELADAVDAAAEGEFAYAAVGVFADAPFEDGAEDTTTKIDSITVDGTTYAFVDGLPAVAQNTKVQLSEIGLEVDGYPTEDWFFGGNAAFPDAYKTATVTGGNLVLTQKTQILTELNDVTSLRSVAANGLAVTTTDATSGDAFLQIAAGWDGGWTTLRPAAATKGVNEAGFGDAWISSKPLTGNVTEGTLDELVSLVDAAADGSFDYVAVGAYADNLTEAAATTVASFQVGTEKVTFANEATVVVSAVTVSGTPKVGATLSASYVANYTDTTATYQWLRDGKAIKGATSSTYKLTATDLKTKVAVKATVAKEGIAKKTAKNSSTVTVAAGSLAFTTAPAVVGTPQVGVKLTAARAANGVDNTAATASTYGYQWYRGTTAIKGATKSSYVPVFADLDKALSVKVTAKLSGYSVLSATSAPAESVIEGEFVTKKPTISGTVKVGKTLTAKTAKWSAAPSYKYAWFAGEELVQFSSSKTLKLTWEHKGQTITVQVVGSQQGYVKAESPVSNATAVVK